MNETDFGALIDMIRPLGYVFGAYVLYSVIRSIFAKKKNEKNLKK